MYRTTNSILVLSLIGLVAGCTEAPEPTAPSAEAALLAPGSAPSASHSASDPGRQVLMLDACDPKTFNEAFGFEICTPANPNRAGGITFSTFVELLEKHQEVDAWRFAPDVIHVTGPVTISVPNRGGIPHSFTEVAEFGGGFVPFLNALSGNPVPAPECVHPDNPAAPHPDVRLIAPGDHDTHTFESGQMKKFMCCIHPWMRAVSR